MRNKLLPLAALAIIAAMAFKTFPTHSQSVKHRENGWYRIMDGQKTASLPGPSLA